MGVIRDQAEKFWNGEITVTQQHPLTATGESEEVAAGRGAELNNCERSNPIFASRNFNPTARQPKPYFKLRLKLIDDASAKYFVGQLTSPIVKPCHKTCASI